MANTVLMQNSVPTPSPGTPIVVAALYKFVALPDFETRQAHLKRVCLRAGVKGTLLLAHEGINGTVAGTHNAISALLDYLRQQAPFSDVEVKYSFAAEMPFHRLKVRLKKEIVTLGQPAIDPTNTVGTYVAPQDWNALIEDPDTLVIDTRNDYEVAIGTFENAINPETKSFREFADYVEHQLKPLVAETKPAKIAMFCTGGIRCEKSTSYLLEQGFGNVFHLKGGILKYLEEMPDEDSKWQGDCFVFDERMSLKPPGAHQGDTPKGICVHTQEPTQNFINCLHDPCHKLILVHPHALEVDPQNQLCPECKAQGRTLETAHYKGSPSQPAKKTPKQRRNRQERRSGDIAASADAQGPQETQDA